MCALAALLAPAGVTQAASLNPFVYQAPGHRFVWRAAARAHPSPPRAGAALLRKPVWLTRVLITEYYAAPEKWALGVPVNTPGLRGKHRIDWLYSGLGVSMEGTGIGLDGRYYHIEELGRGGWVSRAGKPTFDGRHSNGPPYWRSGGYWKNSSGGVTFQLLSGKWSNGVGGTYVPPPAGISFAPGPGVRGLKYYGTIAVDPALIPLGSRIYIPYYKNTRLSRTGWFVANDTGGAIKGRHIDVYRPPPPVVDDPGRLLRNQRIYVIPARR